MANYLCGRCRSNTCEHITPSTHAFLADRYMKGEIGRANREYLIPLDNIPDHHKAIAEEFRMRQAIGMMGMPVHTPPPENKSRKKLLLLGSSVK